MILVIFFSRRNTLIRGCSIIDQIIVHLYIGLFIFVLLNLYSHT